MISRAKWYLIFSAATLAGLVLIAVVLDFFGSQYTNLSKEEAVAAAKEDAGYITHDEPILETHVVQTTFADAFGPGRGDTPAESVVWKVSFKGLFYEPEGPPVPASPRPVRTPTCAQITVVVDDATGDGLLLTVGRSTGCRSKT